MNELAKFKKKLARGELKEAAEWIKEGPTPFLTESELRAVLAMLADAILEDKPRPGQFTGQKTVSYHESDDETGAKFAVKRDVSQAEWERLIYLAVKPNTNANGRVRSGTYSAVAKKFDTSEPNVKRIWDKHKNS